jgi:hypothetical protein
MFSKTKIRATIAILVLVFSCLHESRQFLERAGQLRRLDLGTDSRSLQDQRFEAIRGDLPSFGVIGYIEDPPSGNGATYFFVQYALSPLVVDAYNEHNIVIGNSFHSENKPTFSAWPDLQIVKSYGNGIFLLRRRN